MAQDNHLFGEIEMTARDINTKISKSYVDISRGTDVIYGQNMLFPDNAMIDAFCRQRVSLPESVFDSYEIQGKKTLYWTENQIGTVVCTHIANQSAIQFGTSMTSGNKVTRSSRKLSLYTPGTSLMVICSGVMGTGQTGSAQRIGFFDAQNGVFFEQKDGVMGVVIRSYTTGSAVDTRVEQSSWNIDTMDGTGPSEIDLDFTKAQIFWFDLEWLGVGRVRFGFVHHGKIYVCHEATHNNSISKVYMTTPMLPVTYEIENISAVTQALTDFRQICCAVIREGGDSTTTKHRNVNNGVASIAVTSTTAIPVISLKLQTAYCGKAMIKPTNINVMSQGNKDCLYEIIYNGTVEGGTFVTAPSGVAMYNITATNCTGGTRLAGQYVSTAGKVGTEIFDHVQWLGASVTGTADTLTIIARATSGVTGSVLSSVDYEEFY
jgi:hypothetical protein